MGLDWDAIRAEYEAKASPQELAYRVADPKVTVTAKRKPRSGPDKYGDGTQATISRARIIELYNRPMKVREIARELGVHPSGVYKHLEAAAERGQVELRDDRHALPGRPRQTRCGKGLHSLEEGDPNVRIARDGSRHCRACSAERARRRKESKSGSVE